MIKVQRQDQLERLVNARGLISVNEAVELLGSSPMTVRRDMDELAAENRVARVRGGARSVLPTPATLLEQPHDTKRMQHAAEKHHIAQLAAELIENGDTVFVGAGSTCELIGNYIEGKTIRVITNSLAAFQIIKGVPHIEVILLGGLYRPKTDVFYGPMTESTLETINLDKVFFGVNGIEGTAITGHNTEIANLQRIAFNRGRKRYILADSSKFGRRDYFTFYDLKDIDALITDTGITDVQRTEYGTYTQVIA